MQGWCCGFVFDDVDSCRDVPQYKVMKYLVFGTILSSLLSELLLTLQAVVMLCFIFDEESFSKMFLSVSARVIRLRLTLGTSSAFYY